MKKAFLIIGLISLLLNACGTDKFVTVNAVKDFETYMPGKRVYTAFQFEISSGWHIYWQNPGDAGLATEVQWVLPKGFGDVSAEYSIPHKYISDDIGDYGYKPTATIITNFQLPLNIPSDTTYELTAYVKWLRCKDICVPGGDTLKISIPVKKTEPILTKEGLKIKERYNEAFPYNSQNWIIDFNKNDSNVVFNITPKGSSQPDLTSIEFYPTTEGVFSNSANQKLVRENGSYKLTVPFDPLGSGLPDSFSGIFVADKPWDKGKSHAIKYKVMID